MNKYLIKFVSGTTIEWDVDGALESNVFGGQTLVLEGILINVANIEFITLKKPAVTGIVKPIKPAEVRDKKVKEERAYVEDPKKVIDENKKRLRKEEGLD